MLTPRALELLKLMLETEEEMVAEGLQVWVGEERTSSGTMRLLLKCLALKDVSDTNGMRQFVISDTGEAILRRPELAEEIYHAVLLGKPFTLMDDQVVPMPATGIMPSR